jgi:hypothetical protein
VAVPTQLLATDEQCRPEPRLRLLVDAAARSPLPDRAAAFVGDASAPSVRRISAAADGGCFTKPFRLGCLTQFLHGAELH